MPRFFWDSVQEACETFEYGGCAGNTNNFLSLKQCNDQCLALKGTHMEGGRLGKEEEFGNSETGMWSEVKEEEGPKPANICSLPPVSGPCKGNYTRWDKLRVNLLKHRAFLQVVQLSRQFFMPRI